MVRNFYRDTRRVWTPFIMLVSSSCCAFRLPVDGFYEPTSIQSPKPEHHAGTNPSRRPLTASFSPRPSSSATFPVRPPSVVRLKPYVVLAGFFFTNTVRQWLIYGRSRVMCPCCDQIFLIFLKIFTINVDKLNRDFRKTSIGKNGGK